MRRSLDSEKDNRRDRSSFAQSFSMKNEEWGTVTASKESEGNNSSATRNWNRRLLQHRTKSRRRSSSPTRYPGESRQGSSSNDRIIRNHQVSASDYLRQYKRTLRRQPIKIFDDPYIVEAYANVPLINVDRLLRGGISLETEAVGRIQFGIPPETIKDSMRLGLQVPNIYIVPAERFCREMGPALGINLAEFEFPAYFNYFIKCQRVSLILDSKEAEENIRLVFEETLLGPRKFRDHANPLPNVDEDFDPSYPKEARPNFYREFFHFRTAEASSNYQELRFDMFFDIIHFKESGAQQQHTSNLKLGTPPPLATEIPQSSEDEIGKLFHARLGGRSAYSTKLGTSHHGSHEISASITAQEIEIEERNSNNSSQLKRALSSPDFITTFTSKPTEMQITRRTRLELDYYQRRKSTGEDQESLSADVSHYLSWGSLASGLGSDDENESNFSMTYSRVRWLGEVATIYPSTATEEEKNSQTVPRVELFKMPGGTEYIVHDIDKNNHIIGKARLRGTVRVPDTIGVQGFLKDKDGFDDHEDSDSEYDSDDNMSGPLEEVVNRNIAPPTFHPPSFGVTVLGNSHGFDKSGSTSGYVLWINGRGVMIDPPPYASATLEREGIRAQMIVALIITHCHADHDAGAFQKVMTGSRVAVITTPTIYKSFIYKYSLLSGLSQELLRHSHRHRPAIIGRPLLFHGAIFDFTYTLHTIPCISFKVQWRGRSMVFTGDHLNSPDIIDKLQAKGVLSQARADSIRQMPLQECDVLLHESGQPPIHTPLDVLRKLPRNVKDRLYVVHTAALPEGSELKVAPTGTAGTIRIDESLKSSNSSEQRLSNGSGHYFKAQTSSESPQSIIENLMSNGSLNAESANILMTAIGSSGSINTSLLSPGNLNIDQRTPQVLLRPACVSDAWFILNLLSAVPFLASLSYANTMEVLEIAQVRVFCANDVILSSDERPDFLCVVWEGTCMEKVPGKCDRASCGSCSSKFGDDCDDESWSSFANSYENSYDGRENPTVWYAGDWTGPASLQPDSKMDVNLDGECGDIVAVSSHGVKVILISIQELHKILRNGSILYRKYLTIAENYEQQQYFLESQRSFQKRYQHESPRVSINDNSFLEVIGYNSVLSHLTASQKRHFESLAEGPKRFEPGAPIWRAGEPVDFAYLIVRGTVGFSSNGKQKARFSRRGSTGNISSNSSTHENTSRKSISLSVSQYKRLYNVPPNSEYSRLELCLQMRAEEVGSGIYEHPTGLSPKEERMRDSRDRFANKVLTRLYSRRSYTMGILFSRGHFLSDTSRMVSGSLSLTKGKNDASKDDSCLRSTTSSVKRNSLKLLDNTSLLSLLAEHEKSSEKCDHFHCSNLVAGTDGCDMFVFPKTSLISFLDAYPGVLLCLLGTQAIV